MARTPSITDEEILEAARAVFFEHGFQAPTAEVARRAGISEGTIFRRFPTKHDLFVAAMGIPSKPQWIETVTQFQDDDAPIRQRLTRLAGEILDFFDDLLPKVSLVMGSGTHPHDIFEGFDEPPPVSGLKALTHFFHREQRAGRIRPCDAEVAARMFLGMLHNFAFAEITGINDYLPMPRPTFIRGAVENLLRGLEAAGADDADQTDSGALESTEA